MSELLKLEALVGPSLIAWLVMRAFVQRRSIAVTVELAGIAIACAIGVTSSAFFLWRLMGMEPRFYWLFDVFVQVLLFGAWYVWWRKRLIGIGSVANMGKPPSVVTVLYPAIAIAAVCSGIGSLWRAFSELPYGWWDGWAIWNLRAAFLSVPTSHWRDGFTSTLAWSHPDYPLLVPASIARLSSFGDNATTFGPRLLAAAFVLSSTLVLAGSIVRRTGTAAMCLALSLVLVPTYLFWGASQTADVPLGTYMLIAVTSLSSGQGRTGYAIAGLATGFALWTKNEGVLVAAAVIVMLAVLAVRSRDPGSIVSFGVGLLFGALTFLTFKLVLATPSDLVHQIVTQQPLEKVSDLSRHGVVARYMAREFLFWGDLPVIPASVIVLTAVGLTLFRWRHNRKQIALGGGVVAIVLSGYYAVYVLTPYDLEWHLRSSWSRLIAQVWPTAIWTAVAGMGKAERSA